MSDHSKEIYKQAEQDLGLQEISGPKSHPRIQLAILTSAKWLNPDDSKTPWCGCIRGLWGLETGTGVPKEHYRASSWSHWGEPVKLADAKRGDTVIMSRIGGNHVALFHRMDDSFVYCLGGNQSNSVNIARFARSLIKSVRRG